MSHITLILITLILDYIDPVNRQVFSLQVRRVPSWQIKSHLLCLPSPRHKLRALCTATCCCSLLILFKSACYFFVLCSHSQDGHDLSLSLFNDFPFVGRHTALPCCSSLLEKDQLQELLDWMRRGKRKKGPSIVLFRD